MTSLLAVEFRRFFARRVVRAMSIVGLGVMLVSAVVIFVQTDVESDFVFAEVGEDGLFGVAPMLLVMAIALGASFVGAEWQAGTFTTLLTWEPRRSRVLIAKMAGVVAGVALTLVALQALLLVVLYPVAAARGTMGGLDGDWLVSTVGTMSRIALAGGLVAIMGLSIASIGRNTAAALGISFGYFLVIENLIRGFKPKWQPWLIADNLVVLIVADPSQTSSIGHSTIEAGAFVCAYAGLLFAVALAFFLRRDVT